METVSDVAAPEATKQPPARTVDPAKDRDTLLTVDAASIAWLLLELFTVVSMKVIVDSKKLPPMLMQDPTVPALAAMMVDAVASKESPVTAAIKKFCCDDVVTVDASTVIVTDVLLARRPTLYIPCEYKLLPPAMVTAHVDTDPAFDAPTT
jgi:hypothetical protein